MVERISEGYVPEASYHADRGDISDATLRAKEIIAGLLAAVMTLGPLAATGLLTP